MTDYLDRPLRQELKNVLRPALAKLSTSHKPGARSDVAILSSPRSGSTWLMEVIATQPGMKYINEPDHKELLERYRALSVPPRGIWLSLTAHEMQDLARYLLDDRRSGLFGPASPFSARHSWRTTRRVLKLIRMTPVVEWISSLGFATVYLLRHPIPQAKSCSKRGHRVVLEEAIADADFASYLGTDVVAYVGKVARCDDLMLQFTTQWCVENVVALNSPLAGRRFTFTTHEQLVTEPVREMRRLAQALGLDQAELLLERVAKPSKTTDSSSAETVASIRAGDSSQLLDTWRKDLSEDEEKRLLEPLEVFGINVYRFGESTPNLPPEWLAVPAALEHPTLPVVPRQAPHGSTLASSQTRQ